MHHKYFLLMGVAFSTLAISQSALAADPTDIGWGSVSGSLSKQTYSGNTDYNITEGNYLSVGSMITNTHEITVNSGAGMYNNDGAKSTYNSIVFEEGSHFYLPTVIDANLFIWDEKAGDYREATITGTSKGYEEAHNILVTSGSTLFANGGSPELYDIEVASGGFFKISASTILTNLTLNDNTLIWARNPNSSGTIAATEIYGDLVLHENAVIADYVTGNILDNDVDDGDFNLTKDITNLTLKGGVNPYFNGTGVISTTAAEEGEDPKTLTFAADDEATTENPTYWDLTELSMSGWNNAVAAANTVVDASDVENFTVKDDAVLNLDGTGENVTVENGGKITVAGGTLMDGLLIQGTAENGAVFDITLGENSSIDNLSLYGADPIDVTKDANDFTIGVGSTLHIEDGGSLTNSMIYGTADIKDGSTADGNLVLDGGELAVTGANIKDVTVDTGGTLTLSNTDVDDDATWEITKGSTLNGVDSDVVQALDTLILAGGLHEDLEDSLADGGNNLVLKNSDTMVDGTKIAGWNGVELQNTAMENHTATSGETLKADEDSTLKDLTVGSGSTLDAEDATLTGVIVIHKEATLVGDYTDIGTREGITTLGLNGGVNAGLGNNIQGNGNNGLELMDGEFDANATTFTNWNSIGVYNEGTLSNYTAENGMDLYVEVDSTLKNLTLEAGSNLTADSGAIISGKATVDAGANLGGSYDYTKIGNDVDELVLKKGMNVAFADGLTSNNNKATLRLTDGEYSLDSKVSGWKKIEAEANVKQEGDITLASGGTLHIASGRTWDFSGHSPFVGTISGNVINDGTMTALDSLHVSDPSADDRLTITGNYTAGSGAKLDIDVDAANKKADVLAVNGKVEGKTTLNLTFISNDDSNEAIQVVENNTASSTGSFAVGSIYGSPFAWEVAKQADGWYVEHKTEPGPGPEPGPEPGPGPEPEPEPVVILTPETGGYLGILRASFEQTRDMTRNVRGKIHEGLGFGGMSSGDDGDVRMWVAPAYSRAKVEKPLDFKADIKGIDAGFDFAGSNTKHRFGYLLSYRKGNYEFSGKGHRIRTDGKADVDITSWLNGLYYNYESNKFLFNAILYAGMQSADVNGKNGVKADSDAFEGGLGLELGYRNTFSNGYTVTPMLAVEHTIISWDDMEDNAGKKVRYDMAYMGEIDLGVKIERSYWDIFGSKVTWYLRPSVVQTITAGDKVVVTGLNAIDTLDDDTMFRIRLGGYYDLRNGLIGNAEAAYTGNSNYDNLSLNLGVRYDF